MTLHEIRQQYPHLFLMRQDWFEAEAFYISQEPRGEFMRRLAGGRNPKVILRGRVPDHVKEANAFFVSGLDRGEAYFACELALMYVHSHEDEVWKNYLWCADTDGQGQRIYMGCNAAGKCEIHRHLHITDRWGVIVL